MNNMRVYISGKIGEKVISDETRQKFSKAQKVLEDRLSDMSTVINPASEEFQKTMEQAFKWREIPMNYQDILLYDLQWLRTCDAIYMLEDWQQSPGGNTEYHFSIATGKKVFFQGFSQALKHIRENYDTCPEGFEYNEWTNDKAREIWIPIEEER